MENTEAEKSEKKSYRKHRKLDLEGKKKNNITWKIQKQKNMRKTLQKIRPVKT